MELEILDSRLQEVLAVRRQTSETVFPEIPGGLFSKQHGGSREHEGESSYLGSSESSNDKDKVALPPSKVCNLRYLGFHRGWKNAAVCRVAGGDWRGSGRQGGF